MAPCIFYDPLHPADARHEVDGLYPRRVPVFTVDAIPLRPAQARYDGACGSLYSGSDLFGHALRSWGSHAVDLNNFGWSQYV